MVNTIGHRESEKALQLGKVYTPQEALKIDLVDEIVPKKDVLAAAEEQMKLWCKIPSEARGISKHLMRAKTLDAFTLNQIADLQGIVFLKFKYMLYSIRNTNNKFKLRSIIFERFV